MIPFNQPHCGKKEKKEILKCLKSKCLKGNGAINQQITAFFQNQLKSPKVLLTPSATAALEMMALLLEIQEGDEVIAPSFTFVSSVNAFVLRGARIKFIDINPRTMNLDETLLENAITKKTRAIIPVHYAGVSCEMDSILEIAKHYNIAICEDAAQGVNAFYKKRPLGSLGEFGAFSFHETKNYTSGGEGGALIINKKSFIQRAEILQEKGTNRSLFIQGMVDKYSWVDIGSSYLLSEIQSAFLRAQIKQFDKINQKRLKLWKNYFQAFVELQKREQIELPEIPDYCQHNGHIFYFKLKDKEERIRFLEFLKKRDIMASFHYVPLHSSQLGQKYGSFIGKDLYTTKESERLVRLPIYYDLKEKEQEKIITSVYDFWRSRE